MKKYSARLIALLSMASAAVFLVASCQKQELKENIRENCDMTITAVMDGTKTINNGDFTAWADGDALSVIHNITGQTTVYMDRFTYSGNNNFRGNARSTGATNDWYAVYPYDANITSAKDVSVNITSSVQSTFAGSMAHLAGPGFPLFGKNLAAAYKPGLSLSVDQALSTARIEVKNTLAQTITVSEVSITSTSEIAGPFSVDITGEEPVWTAKSGATKTVVLAVNGDGSVAAGETGLFFIGVVPHVVPAGGVVEVKVVAKTQGGQDIPCYITKTITNGTTFTANKIKSVGAEYDQNHQTPGGEPTPPPTPAVKGYKLVTDINAIKNNVNGRFILVSANKDFIFTGAAGTSNKAALAASDFQDGIIVKDGCSAYEFTITNSGNNYYLKHNGQNLYCSYSSGDGETGLAYTTSTSGSALSLTAMSDGTFGFHMMENSTDQHLYYKTSSGYFKMGGNHNNHCVYVYEYTEEGGDEPTPPTPTVAGYQQITSEPSDWSGKYVIVSVDKKYIFTGATGSANTYTLKASDFENDLITKNCDDYVFTISKSGNNYNLKKGNNYYYANWTNNTTNGIATSTTAQALSLNKANGAFMFYNNDSGENKYLYYKADDSNFKFGGSGANIGVLLFKYTEGGVTPTPTKQDQTLSFANANVEWTLGSTYQINSSYEPQGVNGAKTSVTFSSSNTSVATINNGKIVIKGAGTTTITANAASSDTYNAGSASYTLKINAAPVVTVKGYKPVTTVTSGKNYLIVSVDKKLLFNGQTGSSNKVTLANSDFNADGIITNSNYSQYAFTITSSGNNYYLRHNNQYLYCSYTSEGTTGLAYQNAQQALNLTKINANQFGFWMNENSTDQYLYYKTDGGYFKMGGGGSSIGVLLYEYTEEGGSVDPTPVDPPTPSTTGYSLVSVNNTDWSGSFIIVSADKKYVFTGDSESNAYQLKSGELSNDVISANCTSYEFYITNSGSNYYLRHGSQYLSCSYSSSSETGIVYTSSQQALSLTKISDKFGFHMNENSTDQYLYYKSENGYFKLGEHGNNQGVYLYKKNGGSSTPENPGTFDLRNSYVANYLADAQNRYTDSNWSTTSVVTNYCSNSAGNRKDIPAPVTINWNGTSGSGNYTLSIYNNSGRSNLETSVTTSDTFAAVYNLIPGRTYYYSVTKNSSTVATGQFSTTGKLRMMKVSDTYASGRANNCRDIGGLTTTSGKTVKYGLVYRGTNLYNTTTAERDYMKGYMNIKMDIDLRSGSGGEQGAEDILRVGYSNAQFNSIQDLENPSKIKTTFTDIINTVTAGNACYIHCYAGADRTGVICVLLEAVLGVSSKDCSIDYELTSFSTVGTRARSGQGNVYYTQYMQYLEGQSGSTFQQRAENVLKNAGITDQQINALRNAMLQ